MPKNKFQEVVFTAIMATIMVYGTHCIYFGIFCGRKSSKTVSF